jgi:hypothetical protein
MAVAFCFSLELNAAPKGGVPNLRSLRGTLLLDHHAAGMMAHFDVVR